jgi:hypothetical protein
LESAEAAAPEAELALLGDKALLFSPSGRSFIAYRVRGRRWIAMGEPAGLAAERLELLWAFAQLADSYGGAAACSPCAPGSTFVSAERGCAPSAALAPGPTDASFYLSGAQAEGVAAFSATGAAGLTYAANVLGASSGIGEASARHAAEAGYNICGVYLGRSRGDMGDRDRLGATARRG